MTTNRPSDELERLLSQDDDYIEDGGFTTRVLEALPPPRAAGNRARALILIGATLIAGLIALVLLGGGQALLAAFGELMRYRPFVSEVPLTALALVVLLVCGGVAATLTEN
jgi:hypothetical protein